MVVPIIAQAPFSGSQFVVAGAFLAIIGFFLLIAFVLLAEVLQPLDLRPSSPRRGSRSSSWWGCRSGR